MIFMIKDENRFLKNIYFFFYIYSYPEPLFPDKREYNMFENNYMLLVYSTT